MPRLRPPYVAQVGLFGGPTLEHNFETLYWVREHRRARRGMVRRARRQWPQGAAQLLGLGACAPPRREAGAGRHHDPGELIDEYCGGMQHGHRFYATCRAVRSGGILPAAMGDIPLDFDTLQPHGCFIGSAAVVVLSDHDTASPRRAT